MAFLADEVLDDGLQYITDNGDRLYITNAEASTYTEATSTYDLGYNSVTPGSPAARTPNGRKVVIPATSGGSVGTSGTASHWAIVDVSATKLIAAGSLSSSQSVTSGNTFDTATFDIGFPDPS